MLFFYIMGCLQYKTNGAKSGDPIRLACQNKFQSIEDLWVYFN